MKGDDLAAGMEYRCASITHTIPKNDESPIFKNPSWMFLLEYGAANTDLDERCRSMSSHLSEENWKN